MFPTEKGSLIRLPFLYLWARKEKSAIADHISILTLCYSPAILSRDGGFLFHSKKDRQRQELHRRGEKHHERYRDVI